MALLGNSITLRVQQHSSGVTNEVIAESTSVDAQFTAEALESTSQSDGVNAGFEMGKNTINVSGDYLLATDAEQFNLLYVHMNAGDKIEVELYRSGVLILDTEGVLTSLADAGGLSDALATGAYAMELDVVALSSYGAEYLAVYNSLTTKPSDAIAAAQNTMVESLVDGGVWAKVDIFKVYAQTINSDGEALKNWINPGTNDSTLVNAPTFTALEGFTGNGTTNYINTNFSPDTDKVNLSLNDASMGIYCRTNNQEDLTMGVFDGGNSGECVFGLRLLADTTQWWINSGGAGIAASQTDSSGMFVFNRTAAEVIEAFRNGSSIGTDTDVSNAVPDLDLYILAKNNNTSAASWSVRQVSVFFMGSSLSDPEVVTLTNAIEVYMDSNGKGVIA